MFPYRGSTTRTSSPILTRAAESAPTTSASPPDLKKGTDSLETMQMFMFQLEH